MLTLYFAPGSSSFAVHIALHEIGLPFEGKPMSFKSNDLRSPAYLALNTEGKVPTLIIDGRPLTEVAAILYYLAKRFPDAGLLPRDDIEADAQALSWMSFAASTLHPARPRGLDHAKEVWGIADRRLGSGWALGRYSIADIHVFRLYWRFANSESHRALCADDGPSSRPAHDRDRIGDRIRTAGVIVLLSFRDGALAPDLRCAIAHRGISRFRVRCFASPRNDTQSGLLRRLRSSQ